MGHSFKVGRTCKKISVCKKFKMTAGINGGLFKFSKGIVGNPYLVVEFDKTEQLHSEVSFLLSLFLRFYI